MFTEFAMYGNIIRLYRWILTYQTTDEITETTTEHSEPHFDQDQLQKRIEEVGEHTVYDLDIPEEFLPYDGQEFDGNRSKAIRYINKLGEYAPSKIQIAEIDKRLQQLDYDINACEDGEIKSRSVEEYRSERLQLRRKRKELNDEHL